MSMEERVSRHKRIVSVTDVSPSENQQHTPEAQIHEIILETAKEEEAAISPRNDAPPSTDALKPRKQQSWPIVSPLFQFLGKRANFDLLLSFVDVYDFEKLRRLCTRTYFVSNESALLAFKGYKEIRFKLLRSAGIC